MHCRLFPQTGNKSASVVTDQLLTFAVAMREGQYGLRAQFKVQSVERALRHVTQRLVLDRYPNPRRASPAQQSRDLPIARLIKKYRDEDPPAEPKLAIPSLPSHLSPQTIGGTPTWMQQRIWSSLPFFISRKWGNTQHLRRKSPSTPLLSGIEMCAFGKRDN
jgi:hypothetical protein